jgi:hypothetical protein
MPTIKLPKATEADFIAECLRYAADTIDKHDNGEEINPDPCVNAWVSQHEMCSRWQWVALVLVDHYKLNTADIRRLARSIESPWQQSIFG